MAFFNEYDLNLLVFLLKIFQIANGFSLVGHSPKSYSNSKTLFISLLLSMNRDFD
jgi:hypothetical protein